MSQVTPKQSFIGPSMAIGLGAGALSAILYLSIQLASPGAMIFVYLSPLPLYFVGLSLGTPVITLAAVTGALATLLLGGGNAGLSYTLIDAAPAVLLVRLGLLSRPDQAGKPEWYPAGRLVAWLAVGAATYFALAALLAAALGNGIWDGVAVFMDNFVSELAAANGREPAPALRRLTEQASTWLPAMIGISWMTMQVINATMAQGLAHRFNRNLRPPLDMADFTTPGPLVYALTATAAASLMDGSIGLIARTLAIFAAFPFLFVGLAVIHALSRQLAARNILLAVFYILLFILGWPIILVAGLGLMDQWIDFRKRFAGPHNGAGKDLGNGSSGGPRSGGSDGDQEDK
jgi:hypothetical protein